MSQFPGRAKKHPRRPPPIYEEYETIILTQMLQRGNIAVDLGAHHGHYAIKFAEAVGPDGQVFAFEPDPLNFENLARIVEASGLQNIVCEKKAVSNKNGTARLYLNSRNFGDHRLYDSGNGWPCVEVETVTLDDYLKDFERPIRLIKMDIQGAEAWALQGMTDIIRKSPGLTIGAEYWPYGLSTAGVKPVSFLKHLQRLGFTLSNISEANKRLELITDVDAFTALYPQTTPLYTNVLASPRAPTLPRTTPPPA